jgi:LuxR family maltose regulon positive regulatory protein
MSPTAHGADADLLLKVTPPRVPKHLVSRARLMSAEDPVRGQPLILVQAPAGFGKTSLLAQWRREHLAQGTVVAWLSAQERDHPQRLVQALALSVRVAAGRPGFGHALLDATPPRGLEGVTLWLNDVAQSALSVVLLVDEADSLAQASRDALAYLVRNAPPNLRTVIAARADNAMGLDDLIDYGQCLVVGPAALRFQLADTIELVRSRFGGRVDDDAAARLHALTEGWPLGLQLALSVLAGGDNPSAGITTLAAHSGKLREHLLGLLLSNLAAADVDFLTRISILDDLHPQLCDALCGPEAAERLVRMNRDTPLFASAEQGEWLHMHNVARDALRERFAALAQEERSRLHASAAAWLDERGMLEDAARHALSAGQSARAYELAERSLYDSITMRGRQGTVLEWLRHLPQAELDRRPRLLLAAAWSLAVSERHEEAGHLVERILAQPQADEELRCECALILGGAAIFADDPDRFAELHDPWADAPALRDPMLLQVHANRTAFRTLLEGEPALARLRQQQAPRGDFGVSPGYVGRWGEFIVGLSYFWEGQVMLGESLLQPTLAGAEVDLGRRSPFACMVAALLAAGLWERDRPREAAALLANRLDVLEHHGLPETVLLGFRTLARIAIAEGAEHRAIELLGALHAVGLARNLPRLRVASLAEQVRMHARAYRASTCKDLCDQIGALLADPAMPTGRMWRRNVEVLHELAQGYAAIAAQEWRRALEPLARADAIAQAMQQGRLRIEILGLRAFVLDRCGEKAKPLLQEAMGLARTYGLRRVFADAHPALGAWVEEVAGHEGGAPSAAPARPARTPASERARATPSMALTPKEREVLVLLERNLSNKEIGLAMQVGEQTVKWHVKNLFAKLDAGTRKQVVMRARILGLLDSDS